ncbi:hypothetical protein KAW43_00740 [Candidatus Parcubacteria bacterium]|nr:hypothetical protein [Candidatus Parcubacteria bacterium]
MEQIELKIKIDEAVNDLIFQLKEQIGNKIECLALTGSYAINKISLDKPDVNIFLCLNEKASAETYIEIGEILTNLVNKFSDYFSIKPEFRPFKFPSPFIEKEPEVLMNLNICSILDKQGEFPFGVPKSVLTGFLNMQKVVFGKDVLGSLDISFNKKYIIKTAFRDLPIMGIQLKNAPSAYNLKKDLSLLMNESIVNGKTIAYLGVEIVLTDEELKNGKVLEFIRDKEKLVSFFQEKYGQKTADFVKEILEARKNFNSWKNDRKKVYEVFKAAYGLYESVWNRLLKENC